VYGPGAWFTDKVNNVIVPLTGGAIRPDVNQVEAATRLKSGLNQVMKSIASANDQGRVAVQEQEWAREILSGLDNPTAFFANKETHHHHLFHFLIFLLLNLFYHTNEYRIFLKRAHQPL
jgi:hypothetical protein